MPDRRVRPEYRALVATASGPGDASGRVAAIGYAATMALTTVAAIGGWRQVKTMECYARIGLQRDALTRIRRYSISDRIDGEEGVA